MRLARHSWRIFPFALAACVCIAEPAAACCGGPDPESEASDSSDVFEGRLRGYSQPLQNRLPEPLHAVVRRFTPTSLADVVERFEPKCRLDFDVSRVFKGARTPTRSVLMYGDCDGLPPPGARWIVFATRNGLSLDVRFCTATGPRDPSELEFLGPGRPPDSKPPFDWNAIVAAFWFGSTALGLAVFALKFRIRGSEART